MPQTTKVHYNTPIDESAIYKAKYADSLRKSVLRKKLNMLYDITSKNDILRTNDEIDEALNEISQETFGYLYDGPHNKRIY